MIVKEKSVSGNPNGETSLLSGSNGSIPEENLEAVGASVLPIQKLRLN